MNVNVGTRSAAYDGTMIPYKFWRRSHAVHHANHAQLEERGIGDVWTMTCKNVMNKIQRSSEWYA
jgi:omega-6 fatty acid desaturase (delta-12 desaturase)